MKIDLNQYRTCINTLRYILDKRKAENIVDVVNEFAASTHVPLIAAYTFAAELRGMDDTIQSQIDNVIKFYGYTEVIK